MNGELVSDVAPKPNPFVFGFSGFEFKAENGFAGFEVTVAGVLEVPKPGFETPRPEFEAPETKFVAPKPVFLVAEAPNPTLAEPAELNGFELPACVVPGLLEPNALVAVEFDKNGFEAEFAVVVPPKAGVAVGFPANALVNGFCALCDAFLAVAGANGFCILCTNARSL